MSSIGYCRPGARAGWVERARRVPRELAMIPSFIIRSSFSAPKLAGPDSLRCTKPAANVSPLDCFLLASTLRATPQIAGAKVLASSQSLGGRTGVDCRDLGFFFPPSFPTRLVLPCPARSCTVLSRPSDGLTPSAGVRLSLFPPPEHDWTGPSRCRIPCQVGVALRSEAVGSQQGWQRADERMAADRWVVAPEILSLLRQ